MIASDNNNNNNAPNRKNLDDTGKYIIENMHSGSGLPGPRIYRRIF